MCWKMYGRFFCMNKKRHVLLLVILSTMVGSLCYAQNGSNGNSSRKFKKYKTKEAKFDAAKHFYDKGMYLTAAELFEQIYPLYMGSGRGDSILFLFASCYYQNGDYLIAAFHFNDFTKKYPFSPRTEEAAFLSAKSYFHNIPDYNLDQTDALYAKESLESFMEYYPKSTHTNECNAMLDTIRNQLAHKAYNIAFMYYNTGQYKAARIAINNLLKDYPNTDYCEKALYTLVKNNYEYALNSVAEKQIERFQETIDSHNKLAAKYPDSEYLAETRKIAEEATQKRDKIIK